MSDTETKCTRCPKCNCFSGMVHVPTSGTYIVFPGGRVAEVVKASWLGEDELCDGYTMWVKRNDTD